MKILLFTIMAFTLSGCFGLFERPVTERIETVTIEVPAAEPIVPPVDQLQLRNVEWIVITPDNIDEVFEKIQASGSELALFALTSNGYENLSLNINDVRSVMQQQQQIIAIYKKQYE